MFPSSLVLVLDLNPDKKIQVTNDNPIYFFETLKNVSNSKNDISTRFEGQEIPAVSKIYDEETTRFIISVDGHVLYKFYNQEDAATAFAVTVILHDHFRQGVM